MNNDKTINNDTIIVNLANEMAATFVKLNPELNEMALRDKFPYFMEYRKLSIEFINLTLNKQMSINTDDKPKTK